MALAGAFAWALSAVAGCSSPDSAGNTPPVANAGVDVTASMVDGEATVMLDAAQSYDPDGDTLQFNWILVEGPGQPDWSFQERGLDYLEVRLRVPGLYVFSVEVTDPEGASTQDLVNVQISPGADAGPEPDAGLPDADVGVEADMELPDAGADAELPDGSPDAAPSNLGPTAVVEADPPRLAVGEITTLSAADSMDDGLGGSLSYTWRLVSGPFGVQGEFEPPGDSAEATFEPLAPGRYTFEVRVSDDDFDDKAQVSVYVTGGPAYALAAESRAVWPVDPDTGLAVGPPIQWDGGGAPLKVVARAGILYIVTESTAVSPGTLIILAPGRPDVRRALPRGAIVTGLYPTATGVWVLLNNSDLLWFTDPLGALTLQPVPIPEAYPNGGGFVADAAQAWVSSTFSEAGVLRLDVSERAFEVVAVDAGNRCNPRDLALDDRWLYLACRNQGAVARVPRAFEGALEWEAAITVGGLGLRADQMVLAGEHVVVSHAGRDFVSVIPVERFELPSDDPARQPNALPSISLSGEVLELVVGEGRVYARVRHPGGSIGLDVFDPAAPEGLVSLFFGPTGVTDLVIDVAEDPSFTLDPL